MTSASSTEHDVLVDAHALLWWLTSDRRLSRSALAAIEDAGTGLVGSGTMAEIAIKRGLGKLGGPVSWVGASRGDGLELLPFDWRHAEQLESLPFPIVAGREHRDPFDRMLVAQALVESVPVVTRDPAFAAYGCRVIW